VYVCNGHLWQATQHQQVEFAVLQQFEHILSHIMCCQHSNAGMAVRMLTSTHAVMQVLYHVCQQIVASKPTTLVEDIASLQQAQDLQVQDQHHILALQFRIGKKELLQSCLWQYDPQQL